MADIYMYADETGNLDYDAGTKDGASTYFGFGTATFDGDHGDALFQGLRLRAELEGVGVQLKDGFHAKNDSARTKSQVFEVIKDQAPRFDTTFLLKAAATPAVREKGQNYLYKLAWYLHLKQIALQVSSRRDTLYVIAGSFGTAARQTAARVALEDVCSQVARDIRLCVWSAASSWGLQVADYGLWAVQRDLEGKRCGWLGSSVEPTLQSVFMPWGTTG
ncbi:DUF3800 domain-containing protein [Sinomonas terrae]|uniref:DUF3800 domain-containing protein n=1 Tax=Sinomonas terrae TaxID=2908838 RepID=A0ABS9TX79_9MICC|nr:DUF3800 domain-containing protein [Sinomonas terrae]MCH6468887.1 DUF3800 domain-containing protein [Sinomonas terrae]